MLKNFLYLFLFSFLFVFMTYAKENNIKQLKQTNTNVPYNTADIDIFFEDWEAGIGNWESKDETSIPAQWFLDTWMAYGGSGESWHMGDTALGTNGGYNNSWYQVLDTDAFTVTGTNPQLTFYHRYSAEGPGGEPAGYDGWDGMNVRISTDGGSTWSVLTNPTPAYTSTSLYSFGFEHNEGPGIPGWAGDQTAWTLVTFDLSSYAGQSVNIRFAFGSDPAFSTGQDGGPATMFAWMIDDILVSSSSGTLFSNNGETAGVTPSNNAATGGDLWHIQTGLALSGSQFADCNNSSDTYVENMKNTLTSDWIYLDPLATDIFLDFYLQGTFSDNNTFPDVDFFGAYVQVQGEASRRFISNITQDPSGDNFVYSDAPPSWTSFSTAYSTGLVDLTSLKGSTIRIIFEFESDADAPIGSALQIEDVRIYTPAFVPVELTSFAASVSEGQVTLNWSTATEINNMMFEVERKSTDGQFIRIGYVDGAGTTTDIQNYSYTDAEVSPGKYSYRLKQVDFSGEFEYSNEIQVDVTAPLDFNLAQNYPNPFNPATQINFSIAEAGIVKLSVYNLLGQEVKALVNGFKEAGTYNVSFNASELSSGTYFYRLESGNLNQVKKMILTK